MFYPLLSQNIDEVFHDISTLLDAFRILFDGNLFGGALESKEILDVQIGCLLEAGPVWIFWVYTVDTELSDLHPVLEALVPCFDAQGSIAKILKALHIDELFK